MRPVILLAFVLAGCATAPPMMWVHPDGGADEARFRRDRAECEYEAVRSTGSYTPDTSGMRTMLGAAISSSMDMSSRRTEIAVACMHARGYLQRPADQTAVAVSRDPGRASAPYRPAPVTIAPPALPPPQVAIPAPPPPPVAAAAPAQASAPASKAAPQIVCEAGVCTFK